MVFWTAGEIGVRHGYDYELDAMMRNNLYDLKIS